MDSFLIVNLNTEPKRLDIFAIDSEKVTHLESSVIKGTVIKCAVSKNFCRLAEDSSLADDSSQIKNDSEDMANLPATESETAQQVTDTTDNSHQEKTEDDEFINNLKSALSELKNKWTSSAVIYSPKSYYSCNINLPFKDEKTISQVLKSEIEDRLSFEADNFIVDHKVVGQLQTGEYDVHLAFAEKDELTSLIKNFNACGLDPVAITPVAIPPSAVSIDSQHINNPDFTENPDFSAAKKEERICCIQIFPEFLNISFKIFDELRSDRNLQILDQSIDQLTAEIRRSILAAEVRYESKFNKIYILATSLNEQSQSPDLACQIQELLRADDKTVLIDRSDSSGLITSALSNNKGISGLFVNFRTGELAKVLSFSNIWQIFKPFMPYLLLCLFLVLMAVFASYYSRESEINSLQQTINQKAANILGLAGIEQNELTKSIQQKIQSLEKQLAEIGSPSRYSPLEILSELSRDFSAGNLPKLSKLEVKNNQLTLSASSDSFEAIEPIEKIFNSKKNIYCSYERKDSGTGTREFTFTVKLCE